MDIRISIVTRLCALLLAGLPTIVAASQMRIGVLAWFGDETAATQWRTLGTALQANLPHTTVSMSYHDMNGLETALAAGQLDFIITNPGHYVVLEARHHATRIATQQIEPGRDSEHVVGSAVIVPSERTDIQTLDDLRGKRIAATLPEGFSGWMTVWAELKRRGIDPEHKDVTPLFAGLPMSLVVESLERGEADAGILRVCLLEHLIQQGHLPAGRYRVLSPQEPNAPCLRSTPAYPGWAFAATAQTPDELSRAALVALLLLDGRDAVLRWGVPADYHRVHAMLRDLQVAPYEFLREHRLETQIRRYWPIGAGLLVLLLLGLLYTLRVEALVQSRTRELSAALEARDEIEENMQTQCQKMDHMSRLSVLGQLSGTLAHELNQPLATIGNYARSLTRRMWTGTLSDEVVAQAAHEIAEQAERAAGILEGIRDFARKRPSRREDCDIRKLVDEIVTLFHGMLPHAPEIRIDDRLPDGWQNIHADRLQVQQVLLNLLKNAYDAHCAIDQASQPIDILIEPADERTRITVRDHGMGLADADQARLFEPFFTTKPDGMGLGLSICKNIVEAHGGQLVATQPDDGPGLCLSFTLPVTVAVHHDAN